ncbi:hypothetical protein [Verminephrobacter eiseniae]|uniref:hypothetical protein n=1 Tax=Verminephrobacter eiseniae TaxID=364317 RepID=UPI0022382632|nr:hypothetical protein [Verminephrobacter eiseniae]MCW5234156.1 hypothetical protein [Verminephrobacter eiseniae]MCW5294288.1 hypothetical protein [Verminephrobacter eiseniae]MCW8184956.1 hypothetical protein [Verminephrobacter eiseniae]MCW8225667.1 hypothetical protein [Verminephrobacter eiseniae]MCW8234101.1 hypothetical protein [Verminephrobacter eiseniae]
MKSKLFAVLLLALVFVAGPASARRPVPIIDHSDIAATASSGKTVTAGQVKQAIMVGAAAKGWTTAEQGDGQLLATVNVRGKHTVMVLIAYTSEKYSLTYQNSIGMNYDPNAGQPLIHPSYNKWVQGLQEAIRTELFKL